MPIDLRGFPANANALLAKHGYDNVHMDHYDMMHVTACDNTWTGDIDEEARQLIRERWPRDFELICSTFDYGCDRNESVCTYGVPGMCPEKLFFWDAESNQYHARQ